MKVRLWAIFLLVFMTALLARVTPALQGFNASPDSVEHFRLACALRSGEGASLDLRAYYPPGQDWTSARSCPLIVPGLGLRPPLLALLLAPFCEPEKAPVRGLQLIPVVAAALAAFFASGLAWSLARRRRLNLARAELAALVAGLAVALHGGLFWTSVRLLTEPLEAALILGACWALCANPRPSQRRLTGFVAGLQLGLLVLTRAEGLLTGLLIGALSSRRGSRRYVLAGWLVLALPWCLWAVEHLSSAPSQRWLLQVGQLDELMWASGAGLTWTFVDAMRRACISAGRLLAASLQPKDSVFLAFAGLLLSISEWRRKRFGAELALAAIALALMLGKAAVWATSDPLRFSLVPSLILIVLGATALARLAQSAVACRFLALVVLLLLFLGPGLRILKRQGSGRPESGAWGFAGWREPLQATGGEGLICSSPWAWSLAGGGPSALLPNRLCPDELLGFLRATRVEWVLLGEDVRHPAVEDAREYGALLQAWGWSRSRGERDECELWRAPWWWKVEMEQSRAELSKMAVERRPAGRIEEVAPK